MCTMKLPQRDKNSLDHSICLGNIAELLFSPVLKLDPASPYRISEDGSLHLFVFSASARGVCPYCGQVSSRKNGCAFRHPQWIPVNGHTTYAHIQLHRYFCNNPDCPHRTFVEDIPDAGHRHHRSDSLNLMIFAISLFTSAKSAEKVCREMGIRISHDSINRMMDSIVIADDSDVEFIGVDDVALRKGMSYQTVVYDGTTHRLLALLDGRDGESLKQYLLSHQKVKDIARDRASAYGTAISQVLPEAAQVADRFHLLQNLIAI